MLEFDSPVVEALVARARTPLDAGSINVEVVRALDDLDLSHRDRGQLLLAQLVVLQGTLSSAQAAAQAAQVLELLQDESDAEIYLSALAISAMISASAGDRATCLERCLDMSGIIRSDPELAVSFRSAANFGAALIVLGAYDLAAPLFVNAIEASLENNEMTGVVISCVNLAMTVSRRALVTGDSIVVDPTNLMQLDVLDDALHQTQAMDLGKEMRAFINAVLTDSAQMRGDLAAAKAHWGDLDALTAHSSESFTQYLCLVEAPLAIGRGDTSRAHLLIERALDHLSTPHIVPLGRVDALKLRSALHEQTGDLLAALNDARNATDLALSETSGFADLLIAQVDKRAALEQTQRSLLDQALVDELSQVGNRRAYEARIKRLRSKPEDTVAILACDIDCFKDVNDQFGHLVGDQVIIRAAAIAAEMCGSSHDVFRYGGDEFVLLPALVSVAEATELGERVRAAFEHEPWSAIGATMNITCSVGVWFGANSSIQQGVAAADQQLYEAKKAGRNLVRW